MKHGPGERPSRSTIQPAEFPPRGNTNLENDLQRAKERVEELREQIENIEGKGKKVAPQLRKQLTKAEAALKKLEAEQQEASSPETTPQDVDGQEDLSDGATVGSEPVVALAAELKDKAIQPPSAIEVPAHPDVEAEKQLIASDVEDPTFAVFSGMKPTEKVIELLDLTQQLIDAQRALNKQLEASAADEEKVRIELMCEEIKSVWVRILLARDEKPPGETTTVKELRGTVRQLEDRIRRDGENAKKQPVNIPPTIHASSQPAVAEPQPKKESKVAPAQREVDPVAEEKVRQLVEAKALLAQRERVLNDFTNKGLVPRYVGEKPNRESLQKMVDEARKSYTEMLQEADVEAVRRQLEEAEREIAEINKWIEDTFPEGTVLESDEYEARRRRRDQELIKDCRHLRSILQRLGQSLPAAAKLEQPKTRPASNAGQSPNVVAPEPVISEPEPPEPVVEPVKKEDDTQNIPEVKKHLPFLEQKVGQTIGFYEKMEQTSEIGAIVDVARRLQVALHTLDTQWDATGSLDAANRNKEQKRINELRDSAAELWGVLMGAQHEIGGTKLRQVLSDLQQNIELLEEGKSFLEWEGAKKERKSPKRAFFLRKRIEETVEGLKGMTHSKEVAALIELTKHLDAVVAALDVQWDETSALSSDARTAEQGRINLLREEAAWLWGDIVGLRSELESGTDVRNGLSQLQEKIKLLKSGNIQDVMMHGGKLGEVVQSAPENTTAQQSPSPAGPSAISTPEPVTDPLQSAAEPEAVSAAQTPPAESSKEKRNRIKNIDRLVGLYREVVVAKEKVREGENSGLSSEDRNARQGMYDMTYEAYQKYLASLDSLSIQKTLEELEQAIPSASAADAQVLSERKEILERILKERISGTPVVDALPASSPEFTADEQQKLDRIRTRIRDIKAILRKKNTGLTYEQSEDLKLQKAKLEDEEKTLRESLKRRTQTPAKTVPSGPDERIIEIARRLNNEQLSEEERERLIKELEVRRAEILTPNQKGNNPEIRLAPEAPDTSPKPPILPGTPEAVSDDQPVSHQTEGPELQPNFFAQGRADYVPSPVESGPQSPIRGSEAGAAVAGRKPIDAAAYPELAQQFPDGVLGFKRNGRKRSNEGIDKSGGIREQLKELKERRAVLAVTENSLSKKDLQDVQKFHELERTHPGMSVAELEVAIPGFSKRTWRYIQTFDKYESERARYTKGKVHRHLKEQMRRTQDAAKEHEGNGLFQKVRVGMRKLEEQNLEKLLGGLLKTDSRWRGLARFASLRTAVSAGLLLGGGYLAATPAAIFGFLAAQRAFGMVGGGVGSYNLIRSKRDANVRKEAEKLSSQQKDGAIDLDKTGELMRSLEMHAIYSGSHSVKDPSYAGRDSAYKRLRAQYLSEVQKRKQAGTPLKLEDLAYLMEDTRLAAVAQERRAERLTKNAAGGVGLALGGIGMWLGSGVPSEKGGIVSTLKSWLGLGAKGAETVVEQGGGDLGSVGATALQAENVTGTAVRETLSQVADGGNTGSGISKDVLKAATDPAALAAIVEAVQGGAAERIPGTVALTIKEGQSIWSAGMEAIKDGKITKEAFMKMWGSAHSVASLASGTTEHVSNLGLVHSGDQILLIPDHGGIPAHIGMIDVADAFHMGTNADLAAGLDAQGLAHPEWLDTALNEAKEASTTAPQEVIFSKGGFGLESGLVEASGAKPPVPDIGREAFSGMFEAGAQTSGVSDGVTELLPAESHLLAGGEKIEFIVTSSGKVIGEVINDPLTPRVRQIAINGAKAMFAQPGYDETLFYNGAKLAREAGSFERQMLRAYRLRELLPTLKPGSAEAAYVREQLKEFLSLSWISKDVRPDPGAIFQKKLLMLFKIKM